MKRSISILVVFGFILMGLATFGMSLKSGVAGGATAVDDGKKEQPKDMVLAKDSFDDKYGEVAFNHETHSTKPYSADGKSIIGCAECHHTDQPADMLKAPLKTSERKVVLTTEALKAADAPGVKSCRSCHGQSGQEGAPIPSVTYPGKSAPTKLNNEVAYHTNCNVCHDAALAARPELKGKVFGTNDCAKCHKPVE